MDAEACPRSDEFLNLLAAGGSTGELEHHAEHCADCADLLLVHRSLALDALDLAAERPPSDPSALWWLARLEGREERARKATWAIGAVERMSAVFTVVVLAAATVWKGPALLAWLLSGLTGSALENSASASQAGTMAFIVVILLGAVVGVVESRSGT